MFFHDPNLLLIYRYVPWICYAYSQPQQNDYICGKIIIDFIAIEDGKTIKIGKYFVIKLYDCNYLPFLIHILLKNIKKLFDILLIVVLAYRFIMAQNKLSMTDTI